MENKVEIVGQLQTLIDVYKHNFSNSWQDVFVRTVSIDATGFVQSTIIENKE